MANDGDWEDIPAGDGDWEDVPAPHAPVEPGEAYLNSATSALPLGKQVVDSLGALVVMALRPGSGVHLSPKALAEAKQMGIELPKGEAPGLLDTYRGMRDYRGERIKEGSEQQPLASGLGTASGVALSLMAPGMPKASVGSGASGRVVSNALTAGGYGALNSLANSPVDLTKPSLAGYWQAAKDASGVTGMKQALEDWSSGHKGRAALDVLGAGALGGLGTGAALSGAAELARLGLSKVGAPEALKGMAISQGRRVLTNGADSLSKNAAIDEGAVEEAIRSGAIRPGSNNAGAYKRLQALTDVEGERYREIVSQLEANGVEGPRAKEIADQLMARSAVLETRTGADKAIPNAYMSEALNADGVAGGNEHLGLTQAEDIKRALQRQAKYGKFEETPLNETKRDIASIYRAANERAVEEAGQAAGEGSQVQALADQFVPVKQRLGRLLTAESAAQRGFSRGAQRSHIGPMEMVVGAAEMAKHDPLTGIASMLATKAIRGRGPSTAAAYGLRLSDAISRNGAPTGQMGFVTQEMAKALSPDETDAMIAALRKRGVPVVDIPTPRGGANE